MALYFEADPVTIATAVGWTVTNASDYRDGLAAYFQDAPVSIDTDLYDPEEMIALYRNRVEAQYRDNPIVVDTILDWSFDILDAYRQRIEGVFVDNPVTVDTALGGTTESIDLFRDGVEGLFKVDPLQISTMLLPPGDEPFRFKLPEPYPTKPPIPFQSPGERYEGDRQAYGKVPGLASLLPYNNIATGVDMTQPGQDIAGKLYTSFDAALKAQTPGAAVASAWAANFATAGPLFAAIGTSAGSQVGQAFSEAVVSKAGNLVQKLAQVIAPEVAAILGQKGNGSLT